MSDSKIPLLHSASITELAGDERRQHLRMLEAVLFAAREPLTLKELSARVPDDVDVPKRMADLEAAYAGRGVTLMQIADGWAFRTAEDLAFLMAPEREEPRKLSRPAMETLAVIAYHQPVTRAEIEDVRGVSISKGTHELLMELGWVRMRGRRRTPGKPITYGTTQAFLDHFMLETVGDLPGLDELKGAGLLSGQAPAGFSIPSPDDNPERLEDEDPLFDEDMAEFDAISASDEISDDEDDITGDNALRT